MSDDDSSGSGSSDTSMAAQHAVYPRGPLKVAPTDGSTKFNAIRIPLIPQACWKLGDPAFDFDSSFVVPAFAPEVATLVGLLQQNAGCPAALFAHADPAGSDAVNKTISDRRAIAVYALLTRQPALWEQLYSSPADGDTWGKRTIQQMLATVLGRGSDDDGNPLPPNSPYYAGAIDGILGPASTGAVKAFQGDAGLDADGDPGPKTRKVLFGAYMDALCTPAVDPSIAATGAAPPQAKPLMKVTDFLGGQSAGPGDLPKMSLQGCGKFNPVVLLTSDEMSGQDQETRNADDAPNRRVIMYLFPPGTKVDQGVWPCPKVNDPGDACKAAFWPNGDQNRQNGDAQREYKTTRDTMACRFYDRFARRSPCEGNPYKLFRFGLLVSGDPWIGNATLRLLRSDGSVAQALRVNDGAESGGYRLLHFRVQDGMKYSAILVGDGGVLSLFDATTLSAVANEPDGDGLKHNSAPYWQESTT